MQLHLWQRPTKSQLLFGVVRGHIETQDVTAKHFCKLNPHKISACHLVLYITSAVLRLNLCSTAGRLRTPELREKKQATAQHLRVRNMLAYFLVLGTHGPLGRGLSHL